MERLDHVGAQLLWNHWGRQWPAQIDLLPEQRSLLERVAKFSCDAPPSHDAIWAQCFDALGAWVLAGLAQGLDLLRMVGQLALDLMRLARRPQAGPWRDVSGHVYQMGTMALPITALAGGMLAADLALGITPAFFLQALPEAVGVANLGLAVFKSAVFGLLIALVGCHCGLRVKPNTQSLGQGTTASVVTSITVVILVDALFAIVFKNVGV